jgi:hypothetical protein
LRRTIPNGSSALVAKIAELKQSLERESRTVDQLRSELSEVGQELKSKAVLTIDDFLPRTSWVSSELDNSQITKVIASPALQPPSRLQHISHTINAHFTKLVQARDRRLDESYTENEAISSAANDFLVSLSENTLPAKRLAVCRNSLLQNHLNLMDESFLNFVFGSLASVFIQLIVCGSSVSRAGLRDSAAP